MYIKKVFLLKEKMAAECGDSENDSAKHISHSSVGGKVVSFPLMMMLIRLPIFCPLTHFCPCPQRMIQIDPFHPWWEGGHLRIPRQSGSIGVALNIRICHDGAFGRALSPHLYKNRSYSQRSAFCQPEPEIYKYM